MFIYSIFDKKAVDFGPLFTSENDETAKRLVLVNVCKDTMLSSSPSDFSLYCLGEYDSHTGDVSGISPVKLVCEVLSLVKIEETESN